MQVAQGTKGPQKACFSSLKQSYDLCSYKAQEFSKPQHLLYKTLITQ